MTQAFRTSLAPAYINRVDHTPHRFIGRPMDGKEAWLYLNMNTEELSLREGVGTYDFPIAFGPTSIISSDVGVEFVQVKDAKPEELYNSVEISKVSKVRRHYQYNPGEIRCEDEVVYHLSVIIRCVEKDAFYSAGNILDILAWNFFITNTAGYIAMCPFEYKLNITGISPIKHQREALSELIEQRAKQLNLPTVDEAYYMKTWGK